MVENRLEGEASPQRSEEGAAWYMEGREGMLLHLLLFGSRLMRSGIGGKARISIKLTSPGAVKLLE